MAARASGQKRPSFARRAATVGLMVWFVLPLLPLLLWLFADQWAAPAVLPTAWGFDGIAAALDQGAAAAFARSVGLGLVVAAVATPLGALTARALVRGWAPFPRILTVLVFLPVVVPTFVAVLGVNTLLLRLNVPPVAGVHLLLIVAALPYTVFAMRVAYAAYDFGYEDEARLLGASRRYVLTRIHMPLVLPALARAAFLAFLVGWSDYVVTVIVGAGQVVTAPVLLASAASGVGNDSLGAVLAIATLLPPVLLLALISRPRSIAPEGSLT